MIDTKEYEAQARIGGGFAICGMAPKTSVVMLDSHNVCLDCGEYELIRIFSGSPWYDDEWICASCGGNGDGYHPFERGWRKKNLDRAAKHFENLVTPDEFWAISRAVAKEYFSD